MALVAGLHELVENQLAVTRLDLGTPELCSKMLTSWEVAAWGLALLSGRAGTHAVGELSGEEECY